MFQTIFVDLKQFDDLGHMCDLSNIFNFLEAIDDVLIWTSEKNLSERSEGRLKHLRIQTSRFSLES